MQAQRHSNIIAFCKVSRGICKEKQFMFTSDLMFGIKIIENSRTYDSQHLYINENAIINPLSPLAKFINSGLIIQVGSLDTFVKRNKSDDFVEPIELYYMKEPGTYEKIEGQFLKFRFFRKLLDTRYSKTGVFSEKEGKKYYNENDCLHFAEFLTMTHGLQPEQYTCQFPYNYETSVLQSDEGIFGMSDEENINLLTNISIETTNNNAVPQPGESYAIVRKELKNTNMYHIAFCLYSHNGVNITLEANADNGRLYLPTFNLYDINPKGLTFHQRYRDAYDNSTTIVLKQRNIERVLQEIFHEIRESETKMEVGGRKGKRKTQRRRMKVKRSRTAK